MDPIQQAAYQEFMLSGSKKKNRTARTSQGLSSPSPSTEEGQPSPAASVSSLKKKNMPNDLGARRSGPSSTPTKAIRPIFKAFQGRIRDWDDANEQSGLVLGSIRHLRDRIGWESDHLRNVGGAAPSSSSSSSSSTEPPWNGWGFRESASSNYAIQVDDVELALHHDLLQHERMLGALRGLLSSMALATDAMGRRLDEWMIARLQSDGDGGGAAPPPGATMEAAQGVYSFLSEELYRKQVLVQEVLDSCHDGLVDPESKDTYRRGDPRQVAGNACKEWPPKDNEKQRDVDRLLHTP
jgi:hypothetical protein